MAEPVTFLVALADPTKSLHDKESGWSISGNYIAVCSDPFPSERVRQWFLHGAIVAVDPKDVKFFYSRKELNAMEKPGVIEVAKDWEVKILDGGGKEKSKEKLINELISVMGVE